MSITSMRRWLRPSTRPYMRVVAVIRDGHVLYPCGCMWNLRMKRYSRRCAHSDERTATPPHDEETMCTLKDHGTALEAVTPPAVQLGTELALAKLPRGRGSHRPTKPGSK